ncbi:truncated ER mannose-binding lectin [Culex quinquefasciatus]|uniref:Truncated ER mannose-binding lectin n=1 Tax=Culex quinquefasciatus TaxID=7176 RepID=B0X557_CULQU|nr:truncated ER mannose-binding lectin [Culex quinquefasciatus]|eukprot:XP_001864779.1 truncated ER mannose-binding lectin [Culex quinquefasciatus]
MREPRRPTELQLTHRTSSLLFEYLRDFRNKPFPTRPRCTTVLFYDWMIYNNHMHIQSQGTEEDPADEDQGKLKQEFQDTRRSRNRDFWTSCRRRFEESVQGSQRPRAPSDLGSSNGHARPAKNAEQQVG